jgi:PAS domain S-box-containing protein
LGVLSGLIGAIVFAGWMLGIAPLRDVTGVVTMKTNTALATLLAGVALVLLIPERAGPGRRWAGRVCAVVVMLLGMLTFSEHLIGWNLGIDQMLVTEPPGAAGVTSSNRMGPPASLCFLLLGPALLLLSRQRRPAERMVVHQPLALVVTLVALLSTLGYVYGANELYGIARYTGIAWPTAVAILALGLGVLCARPHEGLMATVTADDPGGRTIRRLLLPMILLPLALGWMRLAGERYGLYQAALGTAMMMLIFIIVFSTLVYYAGRGVSKSAGVIEQQRQLLAVTLASIGDAVIVTDPQGRVTFLNDEAERLTGWTNGEADGRPLPAVFHIINEQTRQPVEDPVEKVLRLGTVVGLANHTILVAKDGRETPIDDSGAPVRQADGTVQGVVLVFRDFSERKRAEKALQSVAQFPDENPYPVVRIDRAGTVVYANASSEALCGQWRCEIGRPASEPLARRVRETLESGQANQMDMESGGRIFSFLFVPVAGSGYVNLYGHDVTERKQAEEALRESEERFRLMGDTIPHGAWMADAEGRNIYISPLFLELVGMTFEQVKEFGWTGKMPPEDVEPTMRRWTECVRTGRDWEGEMRFPSPDGRWHTILSRGKPVRDAQGQIKAWVGINLDITDRKRAEESLREAKAAAEAASEAKGRFLANISHELRTPMNAILGMVDLALQKTSEATARDFLSTARESADLLLALLNDLLDSAKIESGKLELESAPFSLRRVLDQTTQVLAVRASERGIAFSCRIPPEVPNALVGDHVRLRQVLLNLAGNGIKFTERGEVTVSVRVESQEAGEACLEFAVRDTGVGILQSDLDRIFHPFAQADASTTRRFGGTGLGLSISQSLVGMMGGRIWAESEPGQGSTFYFTVRLPLATELPSRSETFIEISSVPASSLRILLVEDNPANQKLAAYILQDRGHTVEIAGDGRQALSMVEQNQYDMILMDVQMPGIDGLEATKAIRNRKDGGPRVPIIAMTAHAMKGDEERCLAAGMNGYLSKPIDGHEMIALVERLVAESAACEMAPDALAAVLREPASPIPSVVFDPELALKRCFNKRDLLKEMITFFVKDADNLLPQMLAALQTGDLEEVGRLGHRLKGTLVHLGAEAAREAAERVEHYLLHAGEQTEAEEAVRALEDQCEILKAALTDVKLSRDAT